MKTEHLASRLTHSQQILSKAYQAVIVVNIKEQLSNK